MYTLLSFLQCEAVFLEERFEALKINDSKSIEELLTEAEELALLAQETQHHELECAILTYLGRGYRFIGASFKAISSLNKAYILLNTHIPQRKALLGNIYRELGNAYSNNLQDHLTAIDYLFKGYSLNVPELNSIFLNNLGSNYTSLGQYEKARNYLNEGVLAAKNILNLENLAFLHHNLANNSFLSGAPEQSFEGYDACIDYCKKADEANSTKLNHFNIDYIYTYSLHGKSECYVSLNNLDLAKQFLLEGKKKGKKTKQMSALSSLYLLEGQILLLENNMDEYQQLAKTSIDYCGKNNLHNDKQTWLHNLQGIYEKKTRF